MSGIGVFVSPSALLTSTRRSPAVAVGDEVDVVRPEHSYERVPYSRTPGQPPSLIGVLEREESLLAVGSRSRLT